MLWVISGILIAILVLFALYLLAIKPGRLRAGKLDAFTGTYISHRGLFNNKAIPENSIKAFRASLEAGYAIELDVQLTSDERLVVFHDATLKRMCNAKDNVLDRTYEELLGFNLLATSEKIPLFSDVLRLVSGKVPLLIEIKAHGDCLKTTKTLEKELRGYEGEYAIQSFHPAAVAWYKRNRPDVARGILSTDYKKNNMKRPFPQQFVLTNLLLNFWAKPDFIAYNHKYADQFSYKLARKLYKFENAAWTIRSQSELEKARKVFGLYIFDSFEPR